MNVFIITIFFNTQQYLWDKTVHIVLLSNYYTVIQGAVWIQ